MAEKRTMSLVKDELQHELDGDEAGKESHGEQENDEVYESNEDDRADRYLRDTSGGAFAKRQSIAEETE